MSEELATTFLKENWFSDKDFEKKVPGLTTLSGDQVGRRIMLADDRITIGRSPEATIMLRDTLTSRLHIAIEFDSTFGFYVLHDLKSTNGTFVNGNRINEATLKEADKILIGSTIFRFGWSDAIDLQYQDEIENLLNIDELTGLIVKRRFDEELNRYIAVARSKGADLAMIMIDIDGVKKINDTHGHAFGAHTISQTGHLIKAATDQKGLASRFGGDEFMIFLPTFTLEAAAQLAENLRRQVETHCFELEGIRVHPTLSIGISVLKKNDSMDSLFKRADEALYMSKRTGRNKVSTT